VIEPRDLLPTCAAVVLEIGSGMGEATAVMAASAPAIGIVAAEVHTRGVARLLAAAGAAGLGNLRVVAGDGRALLATIPSGTLAGVRCYFPDPWPKARQAKRRLVGPGMLAECARALAPAGSVHLVTDDLGYAEAMIAALTDEPLLGGAATDGGFRIARPDWRPHTRYEVEGLARGRPAIDLLARRVAAP
jgi:tRNA (guanine-N7-)-methyltransferase